MSLVPDLVTSVIADGAGHALLGVRGAGGDVHGLNVFFRCHVAHVVRQPHVHAGGAVNAGDVGLGISPVDVGGQRASRRIGDRVLELRRHCARHQIDHALVITIAADRKAGDIFGIDFRVRVRLIGLQRDSFSLHRHLIGNLPHFHLGVDARDGVRADVKIRLRECPETGSDHIDGVLTG